MLSVFATWTLLDGIFYKMLQTIYGVIVGGGQFDVVPVDAVLSWVFWWLVNWLIRVNVLCLISKQLAFFSISLIDYLLLELWPWCYTLLIHWCSILEEDTLREDFRRMTFGIKRDYGATHSHPHAGGNRNIADLAITNVFTQAGYTTYSVSPSHSDDRNNICGSRCFYTEKTLTQPARFDELPQSAGIKLTDVDYYVHMPALMRKGHPIICYTFVPTQAASNDQMTEVAYKVLANNEVHSIVQGGEQYQHKCWDYECTTVSTMTWWGSWVYSVEQFIMPGDDNRRIVGLFPRCRVFGPVAWLLCASTELKRRQFIWNGWVCTRFFKSDRVGKTTGPMVEYVSVARPGMTNCCTLPSSLAYSVMTKVQLDPTKTYLATTQSALSACSGDKERYPWWSKKCFPLVDTVPLAMCCKEAPELLGPGGAYHVKPITCPERSAYTVINHEHIWDEVKPSMRDVYSAGHTVRTNWITSAICPTRCMANDKASILHRLTNVRNDKEPPGTFKRYVREFLEELIPDDMAQQADPVGFEEVYERQARPSQRAILDRHAHWLGNNARVVQAFMKREAYPKGAAPRNITTLNGDVKMRYSTYLYAFSDHLKTQRWYAFSKTPRQISQAVVDMLQRLVGSEPVSTVTMTDFSKFDGTHSEFLCNLEIATLKRYFKPCYHDDVHKMYMSQYKATGYTAFGHKYDTGYSRLSGSPETSAFNSLDNAFVAFCAYRRSSFTGLDKASRHAAFMALGLYGGDDGLTCNVSSDVYTKTSECLGLTLKPDVAKVGDRIKFLSRWWPSAWSGDIGSYTDVPRQLAKFLLTTADPSVPDDVVLYNKALGYVITDRLTPVLGDLSRAVIRCFANWRGLVATPGDEKWFEGYDISEQFVAPEDVDDLTRQHIAEDLGTDVSVVDAIVAALQQAETVSECFPLEPICGEPIRADIPVVVGDTIVNPPVKAPNPVRPWKEKRMYSSRTSLERSAIG